MPSSRLSYQEAIKENVEKLQEAEKGAKQSYVKDRIRFIRYLKEGTAKSQAQAGNLIGLKSRQSQNLWKLYQQKGIAGLLQARKATYIGRLSSIELSRLLQRLDQDQMMSQKQVMAYLEAEMGKVYTQPAIHYLFKRLKVKLKTGRPVNVRKDKAGEEAFKKNA
jgi:transposase